MKRLLNKEFAKKCMIVGVILYAISYIWNFVTIFSVYESAVECSEIAENCTIDTILILSNIALIIGYVGIGLLAIGVFVLLIATRTKKK